MKLRPVIQALQRDGYARKVPVPPDNKGAKQFRMHCLNPECDGWATVNYGARNCYREGLYNCQECTLRGDAVDLVIALAGHVWDPYEEDTLSNRQAVGLAFQWAEDNAGAEPEPKQRYHPPGWDG